MRTVLSLAILALPSVAWACPYCAGRDDGGAESVVLLGAMIILPFVLAGIIIPAIRRAIDEDAVYDEFTDGS